MKNRKFLIYQLKSWIPIFAVSFAFMAIVFWIDMASTNLLDRSGVRYYYSLFSVYGGTGVLSALIPPMILTLIYPLFIFDYRYKKNKGDTFLQLPLKEGQLKRTRLNIALGMLLVAFTLTYWIGVLILLFRVNTASISQEMLDEGYKISNYNFLGFLWIYLFALVFLSVEFFTNAFLAQLGNTLHESYIYMVMGQVILLLIEFSFHFYISWGIMKESFFYDGFKPATFSLGTPIYLAYYLFNDYTAGSPYATSPAFGSMDVSLWFNLFVPLVVGIGAAFGLYLVRDPSGEYYGKPGPRNIPISIIPHVFYFLIGLLLFGFLNLPIFLMFMLLFALSYYMTLVFIYRSFRVNKRELIIMGAVCAGILVLNLIPFLVSTN